MPGSTPGDDAGELFTRLYEEHRRALHAYLLGRTGNTEAAMDLLQETFLRAWRHLSTLRALDPGPQRAWLFAVARNLVTDSYRRQTSQRAVQSELERTADPLAPATDEPAARMELSGQLTMLEHAIQRLPEEQRTIIALHAMGELTSAQIGEILGQPAGTIRYRLSLARQELARVLQLDQPSRGRSAVPGGSGI